MSETDCWIVRPVMLRDFLLCGQRPTIRRGELKIETASKSANPMSAKNSRRNYSAADLDLGYEADLLSSRAPGTPLRKIWTRFRLFWERVCVFRFRNKPNP